MIKEEAFGDMGEQEAPTTTATPWTAAITQAVARLKEYKTSHPR